MRRKRTLKTGRPPFTPRATGSSRRRCGFADEIRDPRREVDNLEEAEAVSVSTRQLGALGALPRQPRLLRALHRIDLRPEGQLCPPPCPIHAHPTEILLGPDPRGAVMGSQVPVHRRLHDRHGRRQRTVPDHDPAADRPSHWREGGSSAACATDEPSVAGQPLGLADHQHVVLVLLLGLRLWLMTRSWRTLRAAGGLVAGGITMPLS